MSRCLTVAVPAEISNLVFGGNKVCRVHGRHFEHRKRSKRWSASETILKVLLQWVPWESLFRLVVPSRWPGGTVLTTERCRSGTLGGCDLATLYKWLRTIPVIYNTINRKQTCIITFLSRKGPHRNNRAEMSNDNGHFRKKKYTHSREPFFYLRYHRFRFLIFRIFFFVRMKGLHRLLLRWMPRPNGKQRAMATSCLIYTGNVTRR